uniref:TIL domain-containing protein n=1 Tax=Amblyomma maculatum TaxID=34609 RepID=G3MTA6_AMBMU
MVSMAPLSLLFLVAICACFMQASAEPLSSQASGPRLRPGGAALRPIPGARRCRKPNEVWKRCVSSSCSEAKCWRPIVGPACTLDCATGCFCKNGFYRNRRGNCVPWNKCRRRASPQFPVYPPYPGGQLPQYPLWDQQVNPYRPF